MEDTAPLIVMLVVVLISLIGMGKVFAKAGQPGWAVIVPIYNILVLLKVAGKPAWWIVLFLIPLVSVIVTILVSFSVAERFGKGAGFGLGLTFLSPIFYPVLGFGDARYQA